MTYTAWKCLCLAAMMVVPASFPANRETQTVSDRAARDTSYQYRVHGKVRLLFFWVGRDDVGGGTIAVNRTPLPQSSTWTEEIEILFGSNPERVPGGINRWGYGRELSEWGAAGSGPGDLQSTLFVGFMSHSKEENLSEVRAKDSSDKSLSQFFYDGIRSRVMPGEAVSEIHTFSTGKDFDFRDSSPIHCSYRQRLQAGPPDRVRKLDNLRSTYAKPFGFLTAVQAAIQSVIRESTAGGKDWIFHPTSIHYVYNAKVFRLDLKKLKVEERFELSTKDTATGKSGNRVFSQVARLDFNIKELQGEYNHDFTLWVPLKGEYQGIPLRVEDRPRWWLKLVLELVSGSETGVRRQRPAGSADECK
jgi:hypothetical protein